MRYQSKWQIWVGIRLTVAATLLAAAPGCESPAAPIPTVEPGIQTSGTVFEIQPSAWSFPGADAFQVEIPYAFTNRTGAPVYLVNCGGQFALLLERKVGSTWESVWLQVQDTCLSPAIVIDTGAVYSTTTLFWGFLPGNSSAPEFEPHAGTHRIQWVGETTVWDYQDRLPWGEPVPLEHRLSNEFELVFQPGTIP